MHKREASASEDDTSDDSAATTVTSTTTSDKSSSYFDIYGPQVNSLSLFAKICFFKFQFYIFNAKVVSFILFAVYFIFASVYSYVARC